MCCAFGGHFKLLKMLIDANADANINQPSVKSALAWAALPAPPYSYDDNSLTTSDGSRKGCMVRRMKISCLLRGVPEEKPEKKKQLKGGKAGYHQNEPEKSACCAVS